MSDLGDTIIVTGAVAALAASLFRYVHMARIIDHLKNNYPEIVKDLAGGDASSNFLLFRRRLSNALSSEVLSGLGDSELAARIRIYRLAQKGIAVGVVMTLLGVAVMLVQ